MKKLVCILTAFFLFLCAKVVPTYAEALKEKWVYKLENETLTVNGVFNAPNGNIGIVINNVNGSQTRELHILSPHGKLMWKKN